MIYLDNASTTRPIGKLTNNWFNSHSSYSNSDMDIQWSREVISNYFDCKPNEIFFTSSGSESNKICLDVLYNKYGKVGISGMEHKSVLDSDKVVVNDIVDFGMINNETGGFIKGRYGYDLVQGVGKLDKNIIRDLVKDSLVVSFSGHKIHGYKGVAGVVIKECVQNSYNFGYGGTIWSDGIKHMGVRFDYIDRYNKIIVENNKKIRDELVRELSKSGLRYRVNEMGDCVASVNVGMDNGFVINGLAEKEIYVSAGSACTTGEPSHVLKRLGYTDTEIENTIRISWDSIENNPYIHNNHIHTLVCELEKLQKIY